MCVILSLEAGGDNPDLETGICPCRGRKARKFNGLRPCFARPQPIEFPEKVCNEQKTTDSRRRIGEHRLGSHISGRWQENAQQAQRRHQYAAANEQHIQVDLQDRASQRV